MVENGVELDCRNRPEDYDGNKDDDGYHVVHKTANCHIKRSDKSYFKFNKWDSDPKIFKVLDEVKDTLNAAPDIKIFIEGHTDSKGSDKYNKTLFFFFQAEDGIRDGRVTGVQTCALPI